jgi:hypothetical protein
VAEVEAQLAAAVPVGAPAVRQLAIQRGQAVRAALLAKGLPDDRLFLDEPDSKAAADAKAAARPMAQLTLAPL